MIQLQDNFNYHQTEYLSIDDKKYKEMKKNKEIAFTYTKGEICNFQNLEKNPNGAMHDIAGVLGYNGRVLGMMPHPERAMFYHQNPLWQIQKIKGNLKKVGDGILLFKNAINYFRK